MLRMNRQIPMLSQCISIVNNMVIVCVFAVLCSSQVQLIGQLAMTQNKKNTKGLLSPWYVHRRIMQDNLQDQILSKCQNP